MTPPELSIFDAWIRFRKEMPVSRRWAYFDHAAVAPISKPAQRALSDWAEESATEGDTLWPQWSKKLGEIRQIAADLIQADSTEIAFVRNTTEGIGLVAEGYPWLAGDNVVTLADEFPSNQYPWLNLESRGVETRRVEVGPGGVDLDQLQQACDDRTRIVAVSWVGYATGWRCDVAQLADLAHRSGALLFLDAIQGLGVFPLDVQSTGVDFLAADGHKWLLGPEGAGLFYIRREHLQRLRPLGVGWNSVVHSADFARIEPRWKNSAERYEGGSQNMPGLLALGESLRLLAKFGTENLSQRILQLGDFAAAQLTALGAKILSDRRPEHASGILSFELPGRDPAEVRRQCLAAGVVLSCRGGKLRISPHAYNDRSDIERLVAVLA